MQIFWMASFVFARIYRQVFYSLLKNNVSVSLYTWCFKFNLHHWHFGNYERCEDCLFNWGQNCAFGDIRKF